MVDHYATSGARNTQEMEKWYWQVLDCPRQIKHLDVINALENISFI